MTLDLNRPVKFRGFDHQIEHAFELSECILVVYQHPTGKESYERNFITLYKNGRFFPDRGADCRIAGPSPSSPYDLINVPAEPEVVWQGMAKRGDIRHHFSGFSREDIDSYAQRLGVGWTLVCRCRVELTEGVFDE